MGKMSKEQILLFSKELATWIWKIDMFLLDEVVVRVSNITISLDYLARLAEAESEGHEEEFKKHFKYPEGWYESEDNLEDIVPRVAEDEEIEAVIFCEGDLWERLYYCEGYGGNEESRAVYEAFVRTAEKHGLWYEWGSGIIFLYGVS